MTDNKKVELLNKIESLGVDSQERFEGLTATDLDLFAKYRDSLIAAEPEHNEEIKSEITEAFEKGRKEAELAKANADEPSFLFNR